MFCITNSILLGNVGHYECYPLFYFQSLKYAALDSIYLNNSDLVIGLYTDVIPKGPTVILKQNWRPSWIYIILSNFDINYSQ